MMAFAADVFSWLDLLLALLAVMIVAFALGRLWERIVARAVAREVVRQHYEERQRQEELEEDLFGPSWEEPGFETAEARETLEKIAGQGPRLQHRPEVETPGRGWRGAES